jgi:hypothetical protein
MDAANSHFFRPLMERTLLAALLHGPEIYDLNYWNTASTEESVEIFWPGYPDDLKHHVNEVAIRAVGDLWLRLIYPTEMRQPRRAGAVPVLPLRPDAANVPFPDLRIRPDSHTFLPVSFQGHMFGRLVLNLVRVHMVDEPVAYLAGHFNEFAVAAVGLLAMPQLVPDEFFTIGKLVLEAVAEAVEKLFPAALVDVPESDETALIPGGGIPVELYLDHLCKLFCDCLDMALQQARHIQEASDTFDRFLTCRSLGRQMTVLTITQLDMTLPEPLMNLLRDLRMKASLLAGELALFRDASKKNQTAKTALERARRNYRVLWGGLSGCTHCGADQGKLFMCSGCLRTAFCSVECQTSTWEQHRPVCTSLQAVRQPADQPQS